MPFRPLPLWWASVPALCGGMLLAGSTPETASLPPAARPVVAALQAPSPGSGAEDVPAVLFDDFRYAAPVDYSVERKAGSDGSLFGRNPWLEGPDLGTLRLGAAPSRAWYGYGWQEEYADYSGLPCPTAPCPDRTLFDGRGTEVYTEPADAGPGHAVLQFRRGPYPADRLVSPLLTSGFAARTGTWVARVRLPDVTGLRDGNGLGVVLAPLWLKSADEVWETRTTWEANTTGLNWWEANIEMWREADGWKPYAGVNYVNHPDCASTPAGQRFLSAGTSWFRETDAVCTSAQGDRRFPRDDTFGGCTVRFRSPSDPDRVRTVRVPDQSACLDALVGAAPDRGAFQGAGHPYVYVLMQHTGAVTRRALYARREDAQGRPVAAAGFESLRLDQEQANHVDAGFFSAYLQMILYPAGAPVGAPRLGSQDLDLLVDWFLYTPDTGLGVDDAPELVRTVRQRLREHHARAPGAEPVWRVNTTALAVEAPVEPVATWATCNPWRIEPVRDWDVRVEHAARGGADTFTVQLLRTDRLDLRRMFQSVAWRVTETRSGRLVEAVRNQGYTLQRGAHWGPAASFTLTATVTQTSPVSYPPWRWSHGSDTVCPDGSPAARTHTYRYEPARGRFYEVEPAAPAG